MVARQRRPERDPRDGHGQRRARRWRHAAARRSRDRRVAAHRPEREVHEGHPLAAHQRRRPGGARDRTRAGPRPGGRRRVDRAPAQADRPDGIPAARRGRPGVAARRRHTAPTVRRGCVLARGSRHPHVRDDGRTRDAQLLSQGCQRAQAACRQLRLPLPAAQRGHRGQRAAEAARHLQAAEAPRLARRAARSRCSGWPSSRTPTTCARRRRSCSARGCRPTARRCASTTRSPRRRRATSSAACTSRPTRWTRSRAPTPSCSSPSGTSSSSLDWAKVAERMAGRLVLDGRNALDREAVAAAGLTYEGIGRGTLTSLR